MDLRKYLKKIFAYFNEVSTKVEKSDAYVMAYFMQAKKNKAESFNKIYKHNLFLTPNNSAEIQLESVKQTFAKVFPNYANL